MELTAATTIRGIAIVIAGADPYIFTDQGLLVVGNVSADTVRANVGVTSVLAAGPVVVGSAVTATSVPIRAIPITGVTNQLELQSHSSPSTCGLVVDRFQAIDISMVANTSTCYLFRCVSPSAMHPGGRS